MCITNFFPLKNNYSSQHKASQPSNHKRDIFPKQQTDRVEGDKEESDDEILLAALTSPHPEAEEEYPMDDVSLVVAARMLEPETNERQKDYLEGMTSEMFGDDEAFDLCDVHGDLEEVEPLPDARFGLLGSSVSSVQPQGCIDDLPEEVLWEVLWQVPAQDLYRNVSLVCHRWKNIVQDPKVKQPSKLHEVVYWCNQILYHYFYEYLTVVTLLCFSLSLIRRTTTAL